MRQKRRIKKLNKILRMVKSHFAEAAACTDEQLATKTTEFKERLSKGESLDDLLPEAFAVICEADKRILGKFPYDVQILGAIALHQGLLAEMNTGEGKTLVATMPLYLNALTGKSTMLVTTNEYLALRDAEEMGQVYRFMGLTVEAGVQRDAEQRFSNEEKQRIYKADIVYTTHGTLGFDYLLNNLVTSAQDRFMPELYYIIIDEADSVLLDGAQTPLVISGAPRVQSNLYEMADFFVKTLVEGQDYEVEEKKVWLTEEGVEYAEKYFRIDNFYAHEHFEINRHVTLALRAHALFKIEKDYVVSKEGELQLLDSGSGRKLSGVKLRGGQHQALETKERLTVSQENRSVASITYQNLFLLFPKMAGMSGTISDAADELRNVYHTDVVVIPPNRPVHRKDLKDFFFRNVETQFEAAIREAVRIHETGQPVLMVATTIGETEYLSQLLMKEKIPHNVLNANNAFWEAEMIKEAGQKNAMTVATAMAGRGTDIKLGEGVKELGGLAVIGVGRMSNVRQERQARGRAGRQGDPGSSRFFVCLEDEIVNQNQADKLEKYIEGKRHIGKHKLKKIINSAQKIGEEFAVMGRKQSVDYDQVLQRQRQLIYETRNNLLDGGTIARDKIIEITRANICRDLEEAKEVDRRFLRRYILDHISYGLDSDLEDLKVEDRNTVVEYLMEKVRQGLDRQREKLETDSRMDEFVRVATLRALDDAWVEEVDYLQQLQAAVSGRSTAQRNPVFEYQQEALVAFRIMERTVLDNVTRNILLSDVYYDSEDRLRIQLP